jgi:hypothetical protein
LFYACDCDSSASLFNREADGTAIGICKGLRNIVAHASHLLEPAVAVIT